MMVPGNIPGAVRLAHRLRNFSRWDGWLLILGGATVLLGWALHDELLKRVCPGFVAMNPVTALSFIFAGGALVSFWARETLSAASRGGRALAGILMVVGVLKLCDYVMGWHLRFDQWLFARQIQQETGFANQIAPNTAFNILLGGLALWLLNSSRPRSSRWAPIASLMLLLVSLVPLVGYAYRASFLYSVGSWIPMALHTAALSCLLAIGLLLAQTESPVVAVFLNPTPGGAVTRRLLPFAFGVPFVLGALAIWGGGRNSYPAERGICMIVVGSFAAFSALVWWIAVSLDRADAGRREAEKRLQKACNELEVRVAERTASLHQANQELQLQMNRQHTAQAKIREQARLLDEARDAILVLDLEQCVTFWNQGAERLYGWTAEEAMGKNLNTLVSANVTGQPATMPGIIEIGAWSGQLEQLTKTRQPVTVESRWTLVNDEGGKPTCLLLINTNITEKKIYEAQLLRSQRMESLGALAGGIAHDLNNALAPIIIGAELLKQQSQANQPLLVDTILASARRGTEMVKQILSFARGSQAQTRPLPLAPLLKEMAKMLRDTFPKSIAVECPVNGDLWTIRGDVTELHQVLLNLCVNARDAMPHGGLLTLAAANLELNETTIPSNTGLSAGSYVMLSVADTGTGIAPDVLPHIFEPFFSTKPPGQGTGLGLSTAGGILKRHQGSIQVHTEVCRAPGLTFICRPGTAPAPPRPPPPSPIRPPDTVN